MLVYQRVVQGLTLRTHEVASIASSAVVATFSASSLRKKAVELGVSRELGVMKGHFKYKLPCPYMGMGPNLVPLVNIKIAGKWMFIPLKMVSIGIDSYPYHHKLPRNPHRRIH